MAAGAQFRMIGSAIVLSISTSVFNSYVRAQFSTILGTPDTSALANPIAFFESLPEELAEQVRFALANGYNRQTLVLCISAALQIPSALLLWERGKQLVV
ncbi:hypothetical protein F5Y14DRAFT_338081 [Nemania sp. NC0429]|nr:hypothetical protein F5Y14DRAFT_338081 [Nemania sp. NC0429]